MTLSILLSNTIIASANTYETYKVTGSASSTVRNAGGYEYFNGTYELKNAYLIKNDSNMWLCFAFDDIGDIRLYMTRQYREKWTLKNFNESDYTSLSYNSFSDPILTPYTRLLSYNYERDIYIQFYFHPELEQVLNTNTISSGQYSGTGKASVETAFGSFSLGNLAKTKIKAIITDNGLNLAFQTKNLPYQVYADLTFIDSDGITTYQYSDENEEWLITITPQGELSGSLTYLGSNGPKGTMCFSMSLQTN